MLLISKKKSQMIAYMKTVYISLKKLTVLIYLKTWVW